MPLQLSNDYLAEMSRLFGDEYAAFSASYSKPAAHGVRVNTLKLSPEKFKKISPFELEPIPWCESGFYVRGEKFGGHPYHAAGLYYVQEPSAMSVGESIDAWQLDLSHDYLRVLDMCAAPGGKTTHIAAKMNGNGILFANEIIESRARVLSQNVERLGIKNCIVTNETPVALAARFPSYYNVVLVDAPCSGEGMFRKNPDAVCEWTADSPSHCASRQLEILESADMLLADGGILVYSTCTFSRCENEEVIENFLTHHSSYRLTSCKLEKYFGENRIAAEYNAALKKTLRPLPHKIRGEGHFIAVLEKSGEYHDFSPEKAEMPLTESVTSFFAENLHFIPHGRFEHFGGNLFLLPDGTPPLNGLRVMRPGLHLGAFKKNRFEPSHSLALALNSSDTVRAIDLQADSPEIVAYLKGETLTVDGEKGWNLVCIDGYPLGWGKLADGCLKNHYPKGLRRF